jgi:serine/threonine-protein kinase
MHTSIGPYRVIDYVGAGGMGTVYRVSHRSTGRIAAAKVMGSSAGAPRSLERFRNEARILQALAHPSIAAMYDFLDVNGSPCLVMEYVDGDTIDHRLRTQGPLPLPEAIRVFTALVDAVGYIHQRGIIHRDLKTNNVKIDSQGAVKLLDFGIATAEGAPRLTSTGNVVGTLMSLAPEQLRTGRAEPRSDIWALGILFYEMLTARPPFTGEAPGILSERIMRGSYTPASELRPDLPRDVDRIIARCLRVRPEDRYATAEALLTELRALQSGEKLVNTPIEFFRTSGEIATTIARQWRLAASGAVALCAIAFFLWSLRAPVIGPGRPTPTAIRGAADTVARSGPLASDTEGLTADERASIERTRDDRSGAAGSRSTAVIGHRSAADSMSRRPLIIRVLEGTADVYIDDVRVGTTPYTLRAPPGREVQLLLRRDGCDDLRRALRLEEGMQETVESLRNCRTR